MINGIAAPFQKEDFKTKKKMRAIAKAMTPIKIKI
jgi:hypothetical protein